MSVEKKRFLRFNMAKGVSIEECVRKARKYIKEQGICLLLFDVKDSRKYKNRESLRKLLCEMTERLNYKFAKYFPENDLRCANKKEKGFEFLFSDSSLAGINSAEIIPEIVNYQKREYSEVTLHWNVAKDGWDDEGIEIIK
jgi:hypothetical protein